MTKKRVLDLHGAIVGLKEGCSHCIWIASFIVSKKAVAAWSRISKELGKHKL